MLRLDRVWFLINELMKFVVLCMDDGVWFVGGVNNWFLIWLFVNIKMIKVFLVLSEIKLMCFIGVLCLGVRMSDVFLVILDRVVLILFKNVCILLDLLLMVLLIFC